MKRIEESERDGLGGKQTDPSYPPAVRFDQFFFFNSSLVESSHRKTFLVHTAKHPERCEKDEETENFSWRKSTGNAAVRATPPNLIFLNVQNLKFKYFKALFNNA